METADLFDLFLRDIRGMLRVSGEMIDRDLLDRACDELGLAPQWREATRGE
jgi:hypothetical protein